MDAQLMSALPDEHAAARDTKDDVGANEVRSGKGRSFAAASMRVATVIVILCAAFFLGGFLKFATSIARVAPPSEVRADAIVVLTGGADRINGALDLLADGHAKRLLISGVHPQTSRDALVKLSEARADLFACCVDLDKKAENTIGNAEQASAWTKQYGFRSVIVVTSAYHMPRSMAELNYAMPDVELQPFPVVRQDLMLHEWYAHWGTTKLLLREYLKYVAARLRLSMEDDGQAPSRFAGCVDCVSAGRHRSFGDG